MKGLIIKPYWADLILSGKKTWEIRGFNTNVRGEIAIIKSGTGLIYGTAVLTNSFPVTQEALIQGERNHRIQDVNTVLYKHPHAWEISSPKVYSEPVPYKHPQGAVIWVTL